MKPTHFTSLITKSSCFSFIFLILFSCSNKTGELSHPLDKASPYDFPKPVDTTDKQIVQQEKKSYKFDGLTFDNEFDGAHCNSVEKRNDTLFTVTINPENEPINLSPWYAFRIQNDQNKKIWIELDYGDYKHRYNPKQNNSGQTWSEVDISSAYFNADSTSFTFPVTESEPSFISAQQIFTSTDLLNWASDFSQSPLVTMEVVGKSKLGRDLVLLDMKKETKTGKKLIVIFSRQHPPEVTGFFAMQAFVDVLAQTANEVGFLDDYRILIYPMLNPDGVDMGNWRHNSAGVDLNRDWAYYNQPEIRQIADHVVKEAYDNGSQVVLGLDFHSTYHDVFYTQSKEELPTPTSEWFRDAWFAKLEERIPGYKVNQKPLGLSGPNTKGWFYTQFKAEGMTYEIGDKTPADSINFIGKIAAEEMMNILMANKDKL